MPPRQYALGAAIQPSKVGGNAETALVDFGLACDSIDGGDLRLRGRCVERAADHQWRGFIGKAGTDRRRP